MAMDMEIDEEIPLRVNGQQNGSVKRRSSLKGKGRQLSTTETATTHDEKRTATLHRIRFLDYMPSSILAIALTPQSYDPSIHHPYLPSLHSSANGREILAVGRQNGEIEIYTWIGGEGTPSNREKGRSGKRRASLSAPIVSSNKQGWVLERRLAPPSPSRVEHLLFTHQTILSEDDYNLCEDEREVRKELDILRRSKPRLFTSGGGSDLWEWEWSNSKDGGMGYVKKSLPSQGGAIWSMAANPSHTTLALGCDDGAVRLVNLWDGALEMLRKFDNTKTRLLSVAWGPQQIKQKSKPKQSSTSSTQSSIMTPLVQYQDSYIVTGCADSTVRKWDIKSGRSTARMTTDKVKGENTLVWTVAVIAGSSLANARGGNVTESDVIVSGDSMGLVKFWDEKTNTQTESLKCHKSDILCLTIGPDGRSVYSSGVDQVVSESQFTRIRVGGQTRSGKTVDIGKWIHTHSRRLHAHDVRAVAVSPSYSSLFPGKPTTSPSSSFSRVPIIISGGYDFSLIYTPAATASTPTNLRNPVSDSSTLTFASSTQRKASYMPQRASSIVSIAREAGVVAERTIQGINLWTLKTLDTSGESGRSAPVDGQQYKKMLEMELNTQTNLISSAISDDGHWLATSDSYETRLWRLKTAPDGTIRARRCVSLATALSSHPALKDYEHHAASHLHFTKDSSKLILGTLPGSHVAVLELPASKHEEVTVLRVFSQHRSKNSYSRALAGRNAPNGTAHEEGESDSDDSEDDEADEIVPSLACMTTSNDGQWLITGDMTGRLHVFNLDSLQYHAALPSVELPPVDIAFSPSNASIVVVALPNNTIQIFDVDQRTIPTWAHSISRNLFASFTNLREPILGLAFDPVPEVGKHIDTLVVYGANYIGTMKIAPSESVDTASLTIEKRKRDGIDTTMNGTAEESSDEETDGEAVIASKQARSTINVTHKYQPILFLDFTSQGDMIVVEKPYFSMLSQMAPAFAAKKYGNT